MNSRASLAVPALALGACFTIGPLCTFQDPPPLCHGPTVCVASATSVVHTARFDFDPPCTLASCGGQVTQGAARLTASIHPSLSAVELDPSSTIALEAMVPTAPDGALVRANVRCDPGGSLFFLGDEVSSFEERARAEPGWTSRQWVLRAPFQLFASASEAQRGLAPRRLLFANRGTARCTIDSVVYELWAVVCTRFCQQPDSGRSDPVDVSTPRQDATTDSPRAVDAHGDSDAAEVETSIEAGNDAAPNDATEADTGLDGANEDAGLDAESPG
ncbi:MAG: hypothetical protein U0269_17815 [Polyangiales bacterium]